MQNILSSTLMSIDICTQIYFLHWSYLMKGNISQIYGANVLPAPCTINYDDSIGTECYWSIHVDKLLDLGGLLCDCACWVVNWSLVFHTTLSTYICVILPQLMASWLDAHINIPWLDLMYILPTDIFPVSNVNNCLYFTIAPPTPVLDCFCMICCQEI